MGLVPNQKIKNVWTKNNREHFESKGYEFTNYRDEFYVDPLDLTKSSGKKVECTCDLCGAHRVILYSHYLDSIEKNNGIYSCQPCSHSLVYARNFKDRQLRHYNRLMEAINKDGYELLSSIDDITGETSRIKYKCPQGHIGEMRLNNFTNNKRCPICGNQQKANKFKLAKEQVIKRVGEVGGIVLNPEDYTNMYTKNLKFICPNCGKEFVSSLRNYTQHGGQRCLECTGNESIGEQKVRQYLEDHNIKFEQEKWFNDCRDTNPLPFDFYLPDSNTIIEFDGQQHFCETNFFGEYFEVRQMHDKIKNRYCERKGIHLIRIPYTKINKVNEILDEELYLHKDIV